MLREEELAQLVAKAGNGDRSAFSALVRSTEGLVGSVVARLLEDPGEVEEVIQDVYVDAHRAVQSWSPGARFTTWLYRAATLAALDRRRRGKRYRKHVRAAEERSRPRTAPSAAEEVASSDTRKRVELAVSRLPERQRAVFVLRHYRDLPLREIAEILEIAEGTVKAHLAAAVRSLRAELAPLVESEGRIPRGEERS